MANVPGGAGPRRGPAGPALPAEPGTNRFTWDLTLATPAGRGRAPLAVPGRYQARLTSGDGTQTRPFEVRLDPRVAADGVTTADLAEQLAVALQVSETMAEATRLAQQVRTAREAAAAGIERLTALQALERRLVTSPIRYSQPMLIDQLNYLYGMVVGADQRIGRDAISRLAELRAELERHTAELRRLTTSAE